MAGERKSPICNFFMYGTLKEGRPLDRPALAELRTKVREATIEGSIYNLGPFPAVKLDGKGTVIGEIHTYPESRVSDIKLLMDRIEGFNPVAPERGLYTRQKVKATLKKDGSTITVWVYEFNGALRAERRIADGVWEPGL